jgi:hypothetical protein
MTLTLNNYFTPDAMKSSLSDFENIVNILFSTISSRMDEKFNKSNKTEKETCWSENQSNLSDIFEEFTFGSIRILITFGLQDDFISAPSDLNVKVTPIEETRLAQFQAHKAMI